MAASLDHTRRPPSSAAWPARWPVTDHRWIELEAPLGVESADDVACRDNAGLARPTVLAGSSAG